MKKTVLLTLCSHRVPSHGLVETWEREAPDHRLGQWWSKARSGRENVQKHQLDKLHSPIFYITGDESAIAFENAADDFRRITKVPVFRACKDGVGHGGAYGEPNGGEFAKVSVAILKWQLNGDKEGVLPSVCCHNAMTLVR